MPASRRIGRHPRPGWPGAHLSPTRRRRRRESEVRRDRGRRPRGPCQHLSLCAAAHRGGVRSITESEVGGSMTLCTRVRGRSFMSLNDGAHGEQSSPARSRRAALQPGLDRRRLSSAAGPRSRRRPRIRPTGRPRSTRARRACPSRYSPAASTASLRRSHCSTARSHRSRQRHRPARACQDARDSADRYMLPTASACSPFRPPQLPILRRCSARGGDFVSALSVYHRTEAGSHTPSWMLLSSASTINRQPAQAVSGSPACRQQPANLKR